MPVFSSPAIDLHAHVLTETYRAACSAAGQDPADGMPSFPEWKVQDTLGFMDSVGVAAAVLSVSSPGVFFGDTAAAIALARSVNDEVAAVVADHPARFGAAASLPLPDVPAAVAEAVRALDVLGADAISLHTHVDGCYLGDRSLDPLYAALDARHALILIHPTSPPCWPQLSFGRPRPILEFPLDTTRAVVNLVLSGVTSEFPAIRWVVPHTGGALSAVADRVATLGPALTSGPAPGPAFAGGDARRIDVLAELRRLYYDVAGEPLPRALPALAQLVPASHIVYGSDYPFTPAVRAVRLARALAGADLPLPLADLTYRNAAALLPRLAATLA